MKNLIAIIFTLITTVGFTQTTVEDIIRDNYVVESIFLYTEDDMTHLLLDESLELRESDVFIKMNSWCGDDKGLKIKQKGFFDIYEIYVEGHKYVVYFQQGEAINGNDIYISVFITRDAAFNRELLPKR